MGGTGSGRHWTSKKTTVEECLTLAVNKLVKGHLWGESYGEVVWRRGEKEIRSIAYTLKARESLLVLHAPLDQDIRLVTTQLHGGGRRWWFLCPSCHRRVGRLHLPRGRNWFLCRHCYDLTYESCQESHKFDSLFLKTGVPQWAWRGLLRRSRNQNRVRQYGRV